MARFNKYKEQLAITPEQYAAAHPKHPHAANVQAAPAGARAEAVRDNRDILADIRDILKAQDKVVLAPAGLA